MSWFFDLFGGEKEKTSEEKKEPSVLGAVKEVAAETAEVLLSGDAMKSSSSTDTKTGTDESLTMGLNGRFHALCKKGNAQDITDPQNPYEQRDVTRGVLNSNDMAFA